MRKEASNMHATVFYSLEVRLFAFTTLMCDIVIYDYCYISYWRSMLKISTFIVNLTGLNEFSAA